MAWEYVGAGSTVTGNGSTPLAMTLPAGIQPGDLLFWAICSDKTTGSNQQAATKTNTHRQFDVETIGGITNGGAGTDGEASGNRWMNFAYTRHHADEEIIMPEITSSEVGDVVLAKTFAYRFTGDALISRYTHGVLGGGGYDHTNGVNWQTTHGSKIYTPGSLVVVLSVINDNAPTFLNHQLQCTEATFSAMTERTDTGTSLNNNIKLVVADCEVLTATGIAGNATYSMTASQDGVNSPAGETIMWEFKRTGVERKRFHIY